MDVTKIIEGIALLLSVLFIVGISRIIYQVAFRPKGVTSAEFKKLVQKVAKPRLNSLGFLGNAWDFSKTENGLTYCIQFVPNRFLDLEPSNFKDLKTWNDFYQVNLSLEKWIWSLVLLQERSGNYPKGLEFIQLGLKQLKGNSEDWVIEFLEEKEKQFNVIG
jgi:hypothetical protein